MVLEKQISTAEEYLAYERASFDRHEFLFKTIIPKDDSSHSHSIVSGNIAAQLWCFLKGKKQRVFKTNMRTRNPLNQSYFYPDVVVSDGAPIFADGLNDILINPVLIIEVLSPTTAVYDKTDKFVACKSIPTLREYVLVNQSECDVEIYRRNADETWSAIRFNKMTDIVSFLSIGFDCPIIDFYEGIEAA